MAHPNEDRLRRGFEAFNTGDMGTLMSLMADDIVWHSAGRNPIAGDHRGIEQVFAHFAQVAELSGGTFTADLQEVLADDKTGYAVSIGTAQRPGKTLTSRDTWVYHFEDGKLAEVWYQTPDLYDVDEFFSD